VLWNCRSPDDHPTYLQLSVFSLSHSLSHSHSLILSLSSKRVNNAIEAKDKRRIFSVLKNFNTEHQQNRDEFIKLVKDSGQTLRDTKDIHRAFREYWQPLFTHEGDDLGDDIIRRGQISTYQFTQAEKSFLLKYGIQDIEFIEYYERTYVNSS